MWLKITLHNLSFESVVEASGYCGDRSRKWLSPHNVSSRPKVVWSRGEAPSRALDFFLLFFTYRMRETIIENSNIMLFMGRE